MLPVKIISKLEQEVLIKKVDKIINLKQTDNNKDISKIENQIDKIVYKIYGLTKKEIEIINEKT